jgi:hypothetical protein
LIQRRKEKEDGYYHWRHKKNREAARVLWAIVSKLGVNTASRL